MTDVKIVKVIPDQEDLGDWLHTLGRIADHWRLTQWELADVLREGIDRMSGRFAVTELYRLASETTGVTVKTLQNLVTISRRFPPDRRVGELSPSFHMVVSGLPDETATDLLASAAEQSWTKGRLVAAVQPVHRAADGTPIPASRNEEDEETGDIEEVSPARRYTFTVEATPSGVENFAGLFFRLMGLTYALMLTKLLAESANRVSPTGRDIVRLVDAEDGKPL